MNYLSVLSRRFTLDSIIITRFESNAMIYKYKILGGSVLVFHLHIYQLHVNRLIEGL